VTAPNVARVTADGPVLSVYFDGVEAGWEQWVMLSADRHHDNPACNRRLERRHLEQAAERGALIVDAGDLFCAMQGKYDPRSSMDEIRPEDVGEDYLDRIVTHAAEDYGPFAANWLVIGVGNHESNVRSRHGTDLISNLVHRLNADYSAHVHMGGYGGWVRFMFTMNRTKRQSLRLKYYHGFGGGGPVTRGTIQSNRQAVFQPDADVVLNGHIHESNLVSIARERLTAAGKVHRDLIRFARTPGYKDEYGDGSAGWAVRVGQGPKPVGCIWMRMFYDATLSRVEIELTEAIQ
jgi:hypothetical protein